MDPDYQKNYYARNRDRRKAESIAWGKANPEKRKATTARYYLNNKEAHTARVKAWYNANPERIRSNGRKSSAKRRALLLGLPVEDFTLEEIFHRDNWLCQLCGGPVEPPTPRSRWSASLDHIVPITAPNCPGHIRSNVQTAHLSCNARKRNRPPEGGRFR